MQGCTVRQELLQSQERAAVQLLPWEAPSLSPKDLTVVARLRVDLPISTLSPALNELSS